MRLLRKVYLKKGDTFIQKITGSEYNNKKLILLNETQESKCQGAQYIFKTLNGKQFIEHKN